MKDYVGQLISSNTQPGYHIVILHIIQSESKYLHYLSLSFYKIEIIINYLKNED